MGNFVHFNWFYFLAEYTFQMEGDGDTALFMNIEKPSIYSETVQKLTETDFR